jgi:hypothetical protein
MLVNAEEPNDESYYDNTIYDQMNLEKTNIREIIMKILKFMLDNWNETAYDIAAENDFEKSAIRNKTTYFFHRRTHY